MAIVKKKGFATIDVVMVVFRGKDIEIAVDTANKIDVAVQTETTDAIKLIKDGRVLAQKPEVVTITHVQLTLRDNIFIPEVVKMLQGGEIMEDENGYVTYLPPAVGTTEKGEVFEIDIYSAVYDEAGNLTMYEKTTYPGCKGTPVSVSSEDNVFRLPEYVINSYAKKGQRSYTVQYVNSLPEYTEEEAGGNTDGGTEQTRYSNETGLEVV